MEEELIKFLKSFDFLTEEEMDIVVEHTVLKSLPKGTLLLKEGEVAKHCYAMIKGCVREYYIIDGMEKTTAFFTEGQPVNSYTSYNSKQPSKHYLECAEDCVVTVGSESLIEFMCKKIPRLEKFLLEEVEKNTGEIQDRLAFYMTSSPEERLLHLLEENPRLMMRVPQHQIASYLGVTPESLSRIKRRVFDKMKERSNVA